MHRIVSVCMERIATKNGWCFDILGSSGLVSFQTREKQITFNIYLPKELQLLSYQSSTVRKDSSLCFCF